MESWVWIEKSQSWKLYLTGPIDDCDRYARCGAYGSRNINRSPACECLNGFEPKIPKDWNVADWSSGCARKVDLSCADGEGFVKHSGLILPDTQSSWFDRNMSLDECKRLCFKNCSCTAYANTDIRGSGSRCLLWFNELIDIREQEENGQNVYIRMAASELAKKGRSKVRIIIIPILLTVIAMLVACLWVIRKKRKCREGITRHYFDENWSIGNGDEDVELPFFDFSALANATNGFSTNSKLGEGGFGPVYKGITAFTNLICHCYPFTNTKTPTTSKSHSSFVRLRDIYRRDSFCIEMRICGETETGAETTRVVGTYGYMSPEMAYSRLNLLGHAWRSYTDGNVFELIVLK
ncbi:hypothetical protein POM88_011031 [Heracleum sosnowskyi]|uniref:Apple domain-containing protein n=1 Tax=Heracleum sosnowskyi TaxID=360622 RepID=A0AAD8IXM6_9APIA|nr:hypothetical protein POM88_011031 [Heracleum sosnowskyi]